MLVFLNCKGSIFIVVFIVFMNILKLNKVYFLIYIKMRKKCIYWLIKKKMDNFRKYIYLVFIGKYIKKIIVCSVVFWKVD